MRSPQHLRRPGILINAVAAGPAARPLFGASALPFVLTALLLAMKRRDQA